jgi:tRNA threonylcarbamoyl adenosine modification protein YeaZ
MILTVETSTRGFSMSLFEKDALSAHIELVRELAHSQHIVAVFEFLLKRLNRAPSTITAAYAGIGPGSFTGIRIGLSFVNTLSQIQSIPLAGISSLDLLAFAQDGWYNSAVTFLRSRKNEVYTAFYREGVRKTEIVSLGSEEFPPFVEKHSPGFIVAPEDDFRDLGKLQGLSAKIVHAFPSSRALYHVVQQRGLTPQKTYLKPLYIRGI